MKRLLIIASTLLGALAIALPVAAQANFRQGNEVNLPKAEIINKNYYAAGGTVTISGTINGDAYVAGGNVIVDGTINGDLLMAGGNVTITGTISHDLRVAGGNVNIDGTVLGNITAVGGTISLPKNASASGTVTAAGGNIHIASAQVKDVAVAAGSLSLDSQVTGDVTAATDNLIVSPGAKISGSLTYFSSKEVAVPQGVVAGSVTHKIPSQQVRKEVSQQQMVRAFSVASFMVKLIGATSMIILGIILLLTMPIFTKKTAQVAGEQPWASLGIGFAALFLFPIAILLLFITLVGIPFALMLLAAFFMLLLLGKVFVLLYIGQRLFGFFDKTAPQIVIFLVGVLLYELVTMLPIIGPIVWLGVTLLGLGVVLIQKKRFYTKLRTQKEI